MKRLLLIILLIIIIGCSSTHFVVSWKNPNITSFNPKKVLVIGITDNLAARKIFEQDFKNALVSRNINAIESNTLLNEAFTSSKKSEEAIDKMIRTIAEDGFDAVIITAVKGVEEEKSYYDNYPKVGYSSSKFGEYYYWYQDIYYNPKYYETYSVYHLETSIYNLKNSENKSLVWVGSFNIVNPEKISRTVNDYVEKTINQLEDENLLVKQ